MKYNDSFSLLFICAFITNVLHRMLSMSSYNNTFFILLVCLVTLLSLITTEVLQRLSVRKRAWKFTCLIP